MSTDQVNCQDNLPEPKANNENIQEPLTDAAVTPENMTPEEEQRQASYELLTNLDNATIRRMHHDSRNLGCLGILCGIMAVACIITLIVCAAAAIFGTLPWWGALIMLVTLVLFILPRTYLFIKCRSTSARKTLKFIGGFGLFTGILGAVVTFASPYLFDITPDFYRSAISTIVYLIVSWCIFRAGCDSYLFGKNHPTSEQISARYYTDAVQDYTFDQHPAPGKLFNEKADRFISKYMLVIEIIFAISYTLQIVLLPVVVIAQKAETAAMQSFANAIEAFEQKNYAAAIPLFQQAAKDDIPQAHTYLGICYIEGWGVEKSYDQAVEHLNIAAGKGEPMAQTCLGSCYMQGFGVEKDMQKSFKYFKMAADNGDVIGQFMTGSCYLYAAGTDKDLELAKKYLKQAADAGHAEAKKLLDSFDQLK